MRLVVLERDDQALDLRRQLVGIMHQPPRTIAQSLEAAFLVAIEDLVAGFARDSELAAQIGHRFAAQQAADKAQALVHHRTLLPRHRHLPLAKSGKCNPCVRYEMSPMSQAAQSKAY